MAGLARIRVVFRGSREPEEFECKAITHVTGDDTLHIIGDKEEEMAVFTSEDDPHVEYWWDGTWHDSLPPLDTLVEAPTRPL
jgi:hypothetical protein